MIAALDPSERLNPETGNASLNIFFASPPHFDS
jgi:hypothetical protein